MTVQEFYTSLGESYDGIIAFLGTDARIAKYLRKFAQDSCHANLETYLAEENWQEAFRMIHSIKGMAANLGLNKLSSVSSDLCEPMRHGAPAVDVVPLKALVDAEYEKVIAGINALD